MNLNDRCDIIAIAGQLGRLDFVSLLLTAIGLILVLGGIFSFINFRGIARKQAKEEAQKISKAVAEQIANEYLQQELPKIRKEYEEFFAQGRDLDDKEADSIVPKDDEGSER